MRNGISLHRGSIGARGAVQTGDVAVALEQ